MANTNGHNAPIQPVVAPVDSKLFCPACNEEMISTAQLNQHLDDAHAQEDASVVAWLKKTQKNSNPSIHSSIRSLNTDSSSQKSPSISLGLEQRLAGAARKGSMATLDRPGSPQTPSTPSQAPSTQTTLKQVMVTKAHWQRESDQDYCSLRGCRKPLGVRFGKYNCRKCGKLYCDEHTNTFMRLASDASHDAENGGWCRVCLDCFKSKLGYNDTWGLSRRKTNAFLALRKKTVHRGVLEGTKLEKRYEKLAKLYADEQELGSAFDIFKSALLQRRSLATAEQSVVAWQEDLSVMRCPACELVFGFTLRRHHCRLCGRVVCGSATCSDVIPLVLDLAHDDFNAAVGEVRTCNECRDIVFSRKDDLQASKYAPTIVALQQHLMKLRGEIDALLPTFNDLLFKLKRMEISVKTPEFQDATRLRKQLVDLLQEYDVVTKQIRALPSPSPGFAKLHQNIAAASAAFVQDHMFTLKLLPDPTKPGKAEQVDVGRMEDLQRDLGTFNEQKSMLQAYQMDAQRSKRFEDALSLQESINEIEQEIERVSRELDILSLS
jgi:rabenosyn-5